jgi:hypothetical protein
MLPSTQPFSSRTPIATRARRGVRALAVAALTAVGLSAVASLALATPENDGWTPLYREQGIVVSTHPEPGVDLPGMRGETLLNADIMHVLAVLLDDQRSTEWAKGADETRVLRKVDAHSQLIYAHSRQPWPVRDRDLIMKRTVQVLEPGRVVRLHLVCTPDERPELEDVVRVRQCETSFLLRSVDAGHTQIDYRVQADPGGKIPAWMVRRASRSIPLDTLIALGKQLELTRGKYQLSSQQLAVVGH